MFGNIFCVPLRNFTSKGNSKFDYEFMSLRFVLIFFVVSMGFLQAAEKERPKYHRCSYTDSENEKTFVFPEFYLSLALNSQIHALKTQTPEERETFHQVAIKNFDTYIGCLRNMDYSVSALVYYNRAVSLYELGKWKEADDSLTLALEQDSRHRDSVYMKARLLINQKNPEKALELLEDAVSYLNQDSDILFTLGILSNEMGNYSKALLYFGSLWNNIQRKDGDTRYRSYVLRLMSELHGKRGEITRSIYYQKNFLKFKPNDVDGQFQLANLLSQIGNLKEAREILLEIEKKNPTYYNAQYLLAEIYFVENRTEAYKYFTYLDGKGILSGNYYLLQLFKVLQGKLPEVKPFLEKFAEKNLSRLSLFLALNEVYSKLGPEEGLLESLKRSASIAHGNKLYLLAIELTKKYIALAEKKPALTPQVALQYDFIATCYEDIASLHLALIHVRRAIDSSETEKEKDLYRLHEANILRNPNLKRYKDSIKILHQVLDGDPSNPNVFQSLGLTYFMMEKFRESVDYFTRAIEFEVTNPTHYYFRALAYEKIGYTQDAIIDLKKIIQLDPANSISYNFLGYLYAEKNIELEESLKLIKKAIDIEPDNPAYQDSFGWVLFRFGKFEESLHHLQLARQLMEEKKEEDPTVYDHLGDVLIKMNDINSAKENYEKAEVLFKEKSEKEKIKEKIKIIEKIK